MQTFFLSLNLSAAHIQQLFYKINIFIFCTPPNGFQLFSITIRLNDLLVRQTVAALLDEREAAFTVCLCWSLWDVPPAFRDQGDSRLASRPLNYGWLRHNDYPLLQPRSNDWRQLNGRFYGCVCTWLKTWRKPDGTCWNSSMRHSSIHVSKRCLFY